jgi:hypothetical protein
MDTRDYRYETSLSRAVDLALVEWQLPHRRREAAECEERLAEALTRRQRRQLTPAERVAGLPAAHLPDDILHAGALAEATSVRWIGGAPRDGEGVLIDPLPAGTVVEVHHRPSGMDAGWVTLTYPDTVTVMDWAPGDRAAEYCVEHARRQLAAAEDASTALATFPANIQAEARAEVARRRALDAETEERMMSWRRAQERSVIPTS